MVKRLETGFAHRTNSRLSRKVPSQPRFRRLRLESLEPRALLATLINTGTASDLVFNLPASANSAILEDDGIPGNNLIRLRSANATFDTTVFANPAGSLTINRGNAADTLAITTLTDLTASLIVGKSGGEFNSITVAGTLALGPDKSLSVVAQDSISLTSTASDITTSGLGSVTLTSHRTLSMLAGSSITTTRGDISLSANEQPGRTSGAFEGVLISQAALTTSGSGKIRIYGRGGDANATAFQHGINIVSGTIRSTSSNSDAGTITLLGQGVGGTQDADGILVHHVNLQPTVIESIVGSIQLTGIGGSGSETFNRGVALLQQTQIRSLGTGVSAAKILINGTANAGTDFNEGVDIGGPNTNLTAVDGFIQIVGTSNAGTGQFNLGIRVRDGAQIVATGTNPAAFGLGLTGTGGFGTTINQGIRLEGAETIISSVNTNILIDGTARATTGTFQDGVRMVDGARITTTGTAELLLQGAAAGSASVGVALRLGANSLSTLSLTGAVNGLRGDRIILDTTNFQINSPDSYLYIVPTTPGTSVNLGSTVDITSGTLELSAAELNRLAIDELYVGSDDSGPVTVSAALTLAYELEINSGSSLTINQSITLADDKSFLGRAITTISLPKATSDITTTGSGSIKLLTPRDIRLDAGAALQSADGDISLLANYDNTNTAGDFQGIRMKDASIITTGAGNIELRGRGGDDAATDLHVGVHVMGSVSATGSGAIIISGTGGAGTDDNNGVVVEFAAGQLSANLGKIQIDGFGGLGSADHNRGVVVLNGGQIKSSGQGANVGKISINAIGGTGTEQNYGLEVFGIGSLISTLDADLALGGQGGLQATGFSSSGVFVGGGGVISTLPSSIADILIQGTGGGSGAATSNTNQGVRISDEGSKIETWTSGTIYIEGTGGTPLLPGNTFSDGIRLKDGGQLLAHGSGPFTLIGRAGSSDRSLGVGLRLAGALTLAGAHNFFSLDSAVIEPDTASIEAANTSLTIATGILGEQLDLGAAADTLPNTLALSDAELDCINVASLVFQASASLTVTADITRPAATDMEWSGRSIAFTAGSVNTAGGDLLLGVSPFEHYDFAVTAPHAGTDINLGLGTLRFVGLTPLSFAINGTAPDTQYDQLKVIGKVDWSNANLVLTGSYHAAAGEGFILVDNDAADLGSGFFNGYPPGLFSIPSGPLAGSYLLDYQSGDGNDVVLTAVDPPLSFTYLSGGYSATDENLATRGPALEQVVTGWAFNIFAEPDVDPARQPTFSAITDQPSLFTATGQPHIRLDGTLTYTPRPNAHGQTIVTVVLQDAAGNKTAPVSFKIEITKPHRLHNAADAGDRNGLDVTGTPAVQPDGIISAGDVLTCINFINAKGSGIIPANVAAGPPYCDVNADDAVAADDVLKIINYINSHPNDSEAEAGSLLSDPAHHDAALLSWQVAEVLSVTIGKRKVIS